MDNDYFDKHGNLIDFYSIFNLPYNAGEDEIKSAFRNLIKRYHPDTAEEDMEDATNKIDLIIQGYRVLADRIARSDYDRILFKTASPIEPLYPTIPKKRIKYSALLSEMLKARFLPKQIKRKDILYNFGQDIEILITPLEARRGAVAFIALPARMHCPFCSGQNPHCHVCRGIGRLATTSQLQVTIPPAIQNNTYIDVDLKKMKPDHLTHFRAQNVRIRITIIKK